MDVIVTLNAGKFPSEVLKLACLAQGFDLKQLIERYLAMLGKKKKMKGFDKQHVERLRNLSKSFG